MEAELAWALFRATGAVEYYLLYRAALAPLPEGRGAALGVSALAPWRDGTKAAARPARKA